MKSRQITLLVLLLASLPLGSQVFSYELQEIPSGVSIKDWSSIRAAYEEGRHQFFKKEDGSHRARNPGQGWLLEFDEEGFMARPEEGGWEWGLMLTGVGGDRGKPAAVGEQRPVTQALGNRLSILRTAQLEEWFINDGRGLEQGWTVSQRPAGVTEVLRLELEVRGSLAAKVAADSVAFVNGTGSTMLTYGGLKAWDATGRDLAVTFAAGEGQRFEVEVDVAHAAYPVTIDPLAQRAYLKADNAQASDEFGVAVAASGDTVVVGAWGEKSNAVGVNGDGSNNSLGSAGAAYVFVRSGATWSQQAYLKASNTGASDLFGGAVSISGDTIVVGATGEDSNAVGVNGDGSNNDASNSGAAYVFVRSGTTWSQQAYLKASNTEANDRFGVSVSVSGDTIVVGAPDEDSGSGGINGNEGNNSFYVQSGAAYVFARSGTVWSQQAYVKASNRDEDDRFGGSVSVSGDTIVVGAVRESSAATGVNGSQSGNSAQWAGAAYVFFREGGVWSQQAYLKGSNTGTFDHFGWSVAVSGDTIVVGAPNEWSSATGVNGDQGNDEDFSQSGAAYVFVRDTGEWSQQAYLKASNTGKSDWFGRAVALSGDTVVVGAESEASNARGVNGNQNNNSANSAGAAYVFERSGTQWSHLSYLKASNTDALDLFGSAVAVSGTTVVVGARGEDSGATGVNGDAQAQQDNSASGAGAAYLFDVRLTALRGVARKAQPVPALAETFFNNFGPASINGEGEVLFESTLSGKQTKGGRNRALLSSLDGDTAVALQSGTVLDALGAGYAGLKGGRFFAPTVNQAGQGIFQVALSGAGGHRAILRDNGTAVSPVLRTGVPVPELDDATVGRLIEVTQHHTQDALAVGYTLRRNAALGVTAKNDTGILFLNHAGGVLSFAAREGGDIFGGGGKFGQFPGRVALATGANAFFITPYLPDGEKARQGLFTTSVDGSLAFKYGPSVGGAAPGPGIDNGETFRAFLAVNERDALAVLRATLKGSPASQNEGLWNCGSVLWLRKGMVFDEANLPGVFVKRILKFWPVGADQMVVQVQLGGQKGAGVTARNNQALLLRQGNASWRVLMRSGSPAPGVEPAALAKISMVEVDRVNGHYVVLGTLRGAPAAANQALWRGRTTLGDDDLASTDRLPELLLRKGGFYKTLLAGVGQIKSLVLRPAVDKSGAGGRGLGQLIGSDGSVVLTIIGNKKSQELVVAP